MSTNPTQDQNLPQPSDKDLSERARYGSLYYTIPSTIFDDDRLTGEEVLFYALLSNLSTAMGYCYASDAWLAKKRKVSDRHISTWLQTLEKFGYISRITEKKGMKWDRKIFMNVAFSTQDSKKGYEQKCASPSKGTKEMFTNRNPLPHRTEVDFPIIEKHTPSFPPSLSSNTENSTTPSTLGGLGGFPPKKEEVAGWDAKAEKKKKMKSKFGEAMTDEAFDNAWKEFLSIPAHEVRVPDALLSTILEKWIIFRESPKIALLDPLERTERIKRHLDQAKANECREGPIWVVCEESCMFYRSESGSFPISYDCSDEEWKNQTGWS